MQVEKNQSKFKKFFIAGLLTIICLAFLFTGVFPTAFDMATGGNNVALVGGESISAQDFLRYFRQRLSPYGASKGKLPSQFIESLRDQTISTLIDTKVLLLYAKKLNFYVSDPELMKFIEDQEIFKSKESKKFDLDLYRRRLAENNLSTGIYENLIREDLIRQGFINYFKGRIFVTEKELKTEYSLSNRKRSIEYLHVKTEEAYAKMKVSNKDLEAFLKDKDKLASARNYYKTNERKYKRGEEVCVRHIVLLSSKTDSDKVLKKIKKISVTKENFAKMASKHSQGPTKQKGGDLGCFGKTIMDKNFTKAAFSLEKGSISAPTKSQFGWHYIYVYDKKPAFEKSFDFVKKDIAKVLLKRVRFSEISKINKKTAENYQKNWSKGLSLKKEKTKLFTELDTSIPNIGRAPKIIAAAFNSSAKIQSSPQVFESSGAFVVAQVIKKQEPDYALFEKEKERYRRDLVEKKMRILFPILLRDIKKSISIKKNESLLKRLTDT